MEVSGRLTPQNLPAVPEQTARLRAAAREMEAAFLSEMLKAAKVGMPLKSFGGGAGEAQFASFLRDEYAREIVDSGGIGLAEHIFESLKRHDAASG